MIGSVRLYRANIDRVRPCYQGIVSTAESWLAAAIYDLHCQHGLLIDHEIDITVDAKTWDIVLSWEEGKTLAIRGEGNGATFSPCGRYRYSLERTWDHDKPRQCWVMLNPSTADASTDDHTVRKVIGFAYRWGYGSIEIINLSPFRSTDPKGVPWGSHLAEGEPQANYDAWRRAMSRSKGFIAAWGQHNVTGFDRVAVDMFRNLACLGRCRDGSPWHPVRVGYDVIALTYAVDGEVMPWQV